MILNSNQTLSNHLIRTEALELCKKMTQLLNDKEMHGHMKGQWSEGDRNSRLNGYVNYTIHNIL